MSAPRPRARELGIPFDGTPGTYNAITDVPGVEVGYQTLVGPDASVRTGVTAILPAGRDGIGTTLAAACSSFNGNGEMTGSAWIAESGILDLPVMITNTHAIGPVHRGVIDWVARRRPGTPRWLLPVVAETWDGYLNDINGDAVRPEHAVAAIDAAVSGTPAEGSVGGGTGMNCYAFKGGSGTASRRVPFGEHEFTVGVFLQANFGSRAELRVAGVEVGKALLEDNPLEDTDWFAPPGAGSLIGVVATDAPLLPGQCAALARRVPLGLARTGTTGSHFSGDLMLAFSTANPGALASDVPPRAPTTADIASMRVLPWGYLDPFFSAVVQATEEAVINALTAADTMIGRDGHRSPGLPLEVVQEMVVSRTKPGTAP